MKLFIIADIHGSLSSLNLALKAFTRQQADYLVILGDVLNHGPRNALPNGYEPAMVASKLNEFAKRIIAVRGNCDSEVDQGLLNFPIDATYNQLLANDRRFFLTHGHVYHTDALPPLSKGDIFCFAHSHQPVAEKRGHLFYFNPGSIALPRGEAPASYGLIDQQGLSVKRLFDDELMLYQDLA
ncbi:phosphodiesterase [Motilimonas cestriensis]|uniref:Phosphoesterase n=1 Tax=Motilimonas cestriensis TaxID=2742685 RepID=A0ABS8W6V5_9GAMM|nr:phosphodiesterase [Motilimonas cestriensis]MCE2593481.1 phosphodiesterase [Motilimonas cestriensis]